MNFLSFILIDAIDEEPVISGVRELKNVIIWTLIENAKLPDLCPTGFFVVDDFPSIDVVYAIPTYVIFPRSVKSF